MTKLLSNTTYYDKNFLKINRVNDLKIKKIFKNR